MCKLLEIDEQKDLLKPSIFSKSSKHFITESAGVAPQETSQRTKKYISNRIHGI